MSIYSENNSAVLFFISYLLIHILDIRDQLFQHNSGAENLNSAVCLGSYPLEMLLQAQKVYHIVVRHCLVAHGLALIASSQDTVACLCVSVCALPVIRPDYVSSCVSK